MAREKTCLDTVKCERCNGKGCGACNYVGKFRLGEHNWKPSGKSEYRYSTESNRQLNRCTICGKWEGDEGSGGSN